MEKITVKELILFRKKSDKSKKTFANKLKTRKPKIKNPLSDDGGGDYWASSTSCIQAVFKTDDIAKYDEKILKLQSEIPGLHDKRNKDRWQKNLDILKDFKVTDMIPWKPSNVLTFEKITKSDMVVDIKGYPIYIKPSAVFSFNNNQVGAIWFIAKKEGFGIAELGMFCEALHEFLLKHHSGKYTISKDHCIAVDTYKSERLTYAEMNSFSIPFLIGKTLAEISSL